MFPLISLYFSQLQSIFLCKHINSNKRRDDNVVGINGQLCWFWLCVVLVLFLGFVSWLSKPRRSVSPSPWLFTENLVHHFAASVEHMISLQQKRKRYTHCDQHFIGIQKQNAEWHWRLATRQKIRRKKKKKLTPAKSYVISRARLANEQLISPCFYITSSSRWAVQIIPSPQPVASYGQQIF